MDPNDSEMVQLKSGSKRYEGVNGDGMGCEGTLLFLIGRTGSAELRSGWCAEEESLCCSGVDRKWGRGKGRRLMIDD